MAKKQTYADRAKSIMKRYEPRLGEKFDKGDALALEAMNQELTALQQEQEQARVAKQEADQLFEEEAVQQFALGGKLNKRQQQTLSTILANRNIPFVQQGLQGQPFNPQAGVNALGQPSVGPQQFPGSEQPFIPRGGQDLRQAPTAGQNQISFENPRDARQFARRAPKMFGKVLNNAVADSTNQEARDVRGGLLPAQFAGGGNLPTYQGNNPYPNQLRSNYDRNTGFLTTSSSGPFGGADQQPELLGIDAAAGNNGRFTTDGFNRFAPTPQLQIPQLQTNMATDQNLHLGNRDALNLNQGRGAGNVGGVGDDFTPFNSRVPWFGAAAQGLGSLLMNREIDFDDDQYTAQQVTPHLVDYTREREQIQRERDLSQSQIRRAARGRGTQQGLTQTTIAGATGAQRIAGQQFGKSLQQEGNVNAQIRNQASQFNAQQRGVTDRLNTQQNRENQLINEQRRAGRIGGVTGAITGYGKDLMAADQYDQMLQIMAPENYQIGRRGPESGFRKALQISDPMQRYFQKGANPPRVYNS